ncbi:MAG TPA: DNA gyrase C-terminal beta-propeller domain-containing protein, partial [Candidatus Paceibacterota bacterium]|nr:DNA gyrase C-terminal beta-propeller domain-containing protein [Candidatus Paceibacterota bacterium]
RRGGRGKSAASFKETDCIDQLFVANTHHTLLCFSNYGRVYWKKVYEIPTGGRGSRGRPVVNLLPLEEGESIQAVQSIQDFDQGQFLLFATAQGTVKKTPLVDYSRPRQSGIIAISLDEGDALVDVVCTDGERDIMLFSSDGKCIRFSEQDVRQTGRSSRGVRGMRLAADQQVISLVVASQGDILTATEHGYGKRTPITEYRCQGRGGLGIIAIQTSERNGRLIDAIQVNEQDEFMLMTSQGTLVRTRASEVSQVGRNTQGVRLIRLQSDESLYAVVPVDPMESDDPEQPIDPMNQPVGEGVDTLLAGNRHHD